MLPLPAEPKVMVFGFAFAAAISSLKLLNGAAGLREISIGASLTMVIGAEIALELVGHVVEERRVDRELARCAPLAACSRRAGRLCTAVVR
jgi:hypothetical protein